MMMGRSSRKIKGRNLAIRHDSFRLPHAGSSCSRLPASATRTCEAAAVSVDGCGKSEAVQRVADPNPNIRIVPVICRSPSARREVSWHRSRQLQAFGIQGAIASGSAATRSRLPSDR